MNLDRISESEWSSSSPVDGGVSIVDINELPWPSNLDGAIELVDQAIELQRRQSQSSQKRLPRSSRERIFPSDDEDDNDEDENPSEYAGVDEIAAPPPVENLDERTWYRRSSLEERRAQNREIERRSSSWSKSRRKRSSAVLVQLYVVSWLIFLSLGTLARLGITSVMYYPNAPIIFSELWANVLGCFVLGFLREDEALFVARKGRTASRASQQRKTSADRPSSSDIERVASDGRSSAQSAVRQNKSLFPIFIGLSVGFCGSFTSFSSFIRDIYLALSNVLFARSAKRHSLATTLTAFHPSS